MIRFFDILFSFLGILFLSPVFLFLYIAIRLESKGGGFYKQLRVGRGGTDFYVYKFRSMRIGADKQGLITVGGRDPRITRIGYFIRKYKLDELPQLFNVLKGDMSLVGPRPLYPIYLPYYTREENLRHSVRGGITGLAQINGRALCRWNDRFAYDVRYVKELSFVNDIKILWHTFFKVAGQSDIGIPSVTDEGGLHIVREVQQLEKIKLVENIQKNFK